MLRLLSREETLRESLVGAGCVDFLVSVLPRGDQQAALEACSCLNNLSLRPPHLRRQLAEAGACAALARVVADAARGGPAGWSVASRACTTLSNLACSDPTRDDVVRGGAVAPLVAVLRSRVDAPPFPARAVPITCSSPVRDGGVTGSGCAPRGGGAVPAQHRPRLRGEPQGRGGRGGPPGSLGRGQSRKE